MAENEVKTNYPAIPEPFDNLASLTQSVKALKEAVELLTGQRGPVSEYSVDQRFFQMKNQVGASMASVTDLAEATASADAALAQMTQILEAEITNARGGEVSLSAKFTAVQTARIDGDAVLTRRADTLEAEIKNARGDFPTLSAKITNVQQASADLTSALANDVLNLQVAGGKLAGQVIDNNQARIDADTAIAGTVTTVTATLNQTTANGQVWLTAEAAPAGYSASYGWYLNGGASHAGMSALVKNDGTSLIQFDAAQFALYDPTMAGPKPVFAYGSGVFTFNVPVALDGGLLVGGTVYDSKIAIGAVSNVSTDVGGAPTCEVYGRAGAKILVSISCRANPGAVPGAWTFYPMGYPGQGNSQVPVFFDAVQFATMPVAWETYAEVTYTDGTNNGYFRIQSQNQTTTENYVIVAGSTGIHTISISPDAYFAPNYFITNGWLLTVTAVELAR